MSKRRVDDFKSTLKMIIDIDRPPITKKAFLDFDAVPLRVSRIGMMDATQGASTVRTPARNDDNNSSIMCF